MDYSLLAWTSNTKYCNASVQKKSILVIFYNYKFSDFFPRISYFSASFHPFLSPSTPPISSPLPLKFVALIFSIYYFFTHRLTHSILYPFNAAHMCLHLKLPWGNISQKISSHWCRPLLNHHQFLSSSWPVSTVHLPLSLVLDCL